MDLQDVFFGWFDMKCSLHGLRIIYDFGMLVEIPNRRGFCSRAAETEKAGRHV